MLVKLLLLLHRGLKDTFQLLRGDQDRHDLRLDRQLVQRGEVEVAAAELKIMIHLESALLAVELEIFLETAFTLVEDIFHF